MTATALRPARPQTRTAGTTPRRRRRRQNLAGWLFVGPVIFGVLFFQLAPVAASLVVSLTNWSGLNQPKFLGLGNYVELFRADDTFYDSLRNTVVFTIVVVASTGRTRPGRS